MSLVCLEIVFLAEVLLRHSRATRWKKRLVQIKVHSIFSSSLDLFSLSVREASGPPHPRPPPLQPKLNSYSPLKLSSNKRVARRIIVGIL